MEEFQKYFTIIFMPEMLKFHPYSILTGEIMVEFVIYCVLIMFEDISILTVLKKYWLLNYFRLICRFLLVEM